MTLTEELPQILKDFEFGTEKYAVNVVEAILNLAMRRNASDLHLLPQENGTELALYFRIDGVLESAGSIAGAVNVVSRLKVISSLLTYRTDIPQEGRVKRNSAESEIRISTFPTLHGEKAVVRFFVGSGQYSYLADLNYEAEIQQQIEHLLLQTSGLLLTCGPAGAGKTTSLYAFIREIQRASANSRSICTLEDPVEAVVPCISQSLVKPETDFNYQRGLISLMRQDPDVIMVGEIRDRETAQIVFQASLTGNFVLSTFHAGTAADALGRLADMDIEPYVIRSGLSAILAQRLLRKVCECQSSASESCPKCRRTGYAGRIVVAELLKIQDQNLIQGVLNRVDVQTLEKLAITSGMTTMVQSAQRFERDGETTMEECIRVFGPDFSS
ncbi:ATPase, T2SS/T4P/T4SS family [bacterium]|nr:ATPase, T2SS/T4P/T4SS family [bacterium]